MEHEDASLCTIYPGINGFFEAVNGDAYRVNMRRRTYTCRKWDITGIPCEHAYGVILDKNLDTDDYVSDWFLTSRWRDTYSSSIIPLRGARFWVRGSSALVSKPPEPPQPGRKKKKKKKPRKKGKNESPSKKRKKKEANESPPNKKVKLSKRTMHCKKCGQVGHNSRSCGKRARQDNGRKASQIRESQNHVGDM